MWELTEFDGVTLPDGKVRGTLKSFDTIDTVVQVAGGIPYDTYGDQIAPAKADALQHVAAMHNTTATALETAYRALAAFRGQKGKLYRTWYASQETEWVYARLKSVEAPRDPTFANLIKGMTCTFVPLSQCWFGRAHTHSFALTSSFAQSLTNAGNVAAPGMILTVDVGDTAITSFVFSLLIGASYQEIFTYSNGIGAYKTLRIDFGTKEITLDGVPAYNSFRLGINNPYDDWFLLPAGTSTVRIDILGGNALQDTVQFEYYDSFA